MPACQVYERELNHLRSEYKAAIEKSAEEARKMQLESLPSLPHVGVPSFPSQQIRVPRTVLPVVSPSVHLPEMKLKGVVAEASGSAEAVGSYDEDISGAGVVVEHPSSSPPRAATATSTQSSPQSPVIVEHVHTTSETFDQGGAAPGQRVQQPQQQPQSSSKARDAGAAPRRRLL